MTVRMIKNPLELKGPPATAQQVELHQLEHHHQLEYNVGTLMQTSGMN